MAKKIVATNRRAKYDYQIIDEYDAGIVLKGHEVKSIRAGNATIVGAFIVIKDDEAWLTNAHIKKYAHAANVKDFDPVRNRKLLLHASEIEKLRIARSNKQAIIPLYFHVKGPNIKLAIATARGKKHYDKRSAIRKKDIERNEQRRFKA